MVLSNRSTLEGGATAVKPLHEIEHDSFRLMGALPGASPLGYIPQVENLPAN
jgi:hypothetical protein